MGEERESWANGGFCRVLIAGCFGCVQQDNETSGNNENIMKY